MDDRNVPYIVFEGTVARFERIIKRLIITLIIAIFMLFVSNAIWLYRWSQYDYENVVVDSQDGGNANYIGASGVINNAKNSCQEEKAQK